MAIADLGLGVAECGVRRGEKPLRGHRESGEGLGIGDCRLQIWDWRLRILDCGVRIERLTEEDAESAEKKWQERS